ncbi:uncharacterized protein LOC121882447 [Thunnus maccoyii]|uniref:uncharacterized protein LOC121882447 n=1 Tax=Thunnus maccoyii TaxID=8240 RepID=UPI001C4CA4E9|nr:uncharacterized protein LOC121882447 [Thunnus maccoyii]
MVYLRESDSAEYNFRFITNQPGGKYTSPGVTLTVTDLQVQVSRLTINQHYSWAELECHSSCHLSDDSSYIWYKNEQDIWGQTSNSYSGSFYSTDSYSCAVKGHEKFPSPSLSGHAGVMYSSTQICAFKGSTVFISCTYRYPSRIDNLDTTVDKTLWFTKMNGDQYVDLKETLEYAGRVQYHCDKNYCTLTIRDLRESDSAEYKFRKKRTLNSTTELNEPVETIELDSSPVCENVSDLQVVAAADRRHRGAGRHGLNQRLDSPDGGRK